MIQGLGRRKDADENYQTASPLQLLFLKMMKSQDNKFHLFLNKSCELYGCQNITLQ